jgi:hypothetical protein
MGSQIKLYYCYMSQKVNKAALLLSLMHHSKDTGEEMSKAEKV